MSNVIVIFDAWKNHPLWNATYHSAIHFYPRLPPTGPTVIVHVPCVRLSIRPFVRPSTRPSVCPSRTTLPQDFSYWPAIWWNDEQDREAHCNLKCICSTIFCAFHWTLEFYTIGLIQVWGTPLLLLPFMDFSYLPYICCYGAQHHEADRYLKLSCLAIFVRLRNFDIFGYMLGPGLRGNDSY